MLGPAGLTLCPVVSAPLGGPYPPRLLVWLPALLSTSQSRTSLPTSPAPPHPVLVPLCSLPSISCSLSYRVTSQLQNVCENYKQDHLSPEPQKPALRGEFV